MAFDIKTLPAGIFIIDPYLWSIEDHYKANAEGWWISARQHHVKGGVLVRGTMLRALADNSVMPPWMRFCFNLIEPRSYGHGIHGPMHFKARRGGVPPFVSDAQAEQWVYERANQGSEFHARAVVALIKSKLEWE